MAELENLAGRCIENCILTEVIGNGADGIVYAAMREGAEVAVKLFFPSQIAKNGEAATKERLQLQLELAGKKIHPNLVEIYSGGEYPELETLYLVMERVSGVSLDKLLGKVPPAVIPSLAKQLAEVARFLEERDLVHRDIKPANIIISEDFQTLTLLDLGIIHQVPTGNELPQERHSGMEFVASLRYSPPEFVWRKEEEDAEGAWQAVTLYQIGATLHDMVMSEPIFTGYDKPHACLYDAVRDQTPNVHSEHVPDWLIQTIQACLLKDWRKRIKLVGWNDFSEPEKSANWHLREKRIRLKQILNEQIRLAEEKQSKPAIAHTREQDLWRLNSALILEVRTYLLNTPIFPKFKVIEERLSLQEYKSSFVFDVDVSRGFFKEMAFTLTVAVDGQINEATKLSFDASTEDGQISSASWVELFSVETACANCQQAFLDAVEQMIAC